MSIVAAIDFETANSSRASACSVGVVLLENGKLVDSYYSLIKPIVNPGLFEFTFVHGITARDVRSAPEFNSVYGDIKKILSTADLVFAHNSSFDKGVLIESMQLSDTPLKDLSLGFGDSLSIARKSFTLENYQLPTVAKHVGFSFSHHHALEDAEASARIVDFARMAYGLSSAEELLGLKKLKSLPLNEYSIALERRKKYTSHKR